jgi:hypothetical protein
MALSKAELGSLASGAGFKGDEIPVIVAIALAESGGNPKAHNATPPDDSYGLLQINMLGALGPARRKQYGLSTNTALYDPATNFRVGYGIYKGSGFKAWTTYTRGTYKKYLDRDSSLVGNLNPATALDNAKAGLDANGIELNPVAGIKSSIDAFGSTLFKASSNMAGIGVGIAFVVIGVVLLNRNAIANVIPAKKALKIVKGVTAK